MFKSLLMSFIYFLIYYNVYNLRNLVLNVYVNFSSVCFDSLMRSLDNNSSYQLERAYITAAGRRLADDPRVRIGGGFLEEQ